jgi:hypothetical protein
LKSAIAVVRENAQNPQGLHEILLEAAVFGVASNHLIIAVSLNGLPDFIKAYGDGWPQYEYTIDPVALQVRCSRGGPFKETHDSGSWYRSEARLARDRAMRDLEGTFVEGKKAWGEEHNDELKQEEHGGNAAPPATPTPASNRRRRTRN